MHNVGQLQAEELVASLAATARDLIAQTNPENLDRTLGQIVVSAVETVPGADAGGISLIHRGEIESRAPFDDTVRSLDALQAEVGEGPSISALTRSPFGQMVVVDDLFGADAGRWPVFAARAEACGYRSILSTQLSANGGPHAALNLYGRDPGVFDAHAQALAGLFGVQTALLLYGAERATNLGIALGSRDVIGQAKGILMERFDVDGDHAFQMLVRSSQDANVKLADVARWLIAERHSTRPANRPTAGTPATELP